MKNQQPSWELFSLEIMFVVKKVYDTDRKTESTYNILSRK